MLELAEVIRDLRDELERAIVEGAGESLRFELGTIELEISIAIEAGARVGAKVRFWVVDAESEGSLDRTSTQRLKLALTPRLGIGGGSPLISGQSAENER